MEKNYANVRMAVQSLVEAHAQTLLIELAEVLTPKESDPPEFSLLSHLYRQILFSEKTFGLGNRTYGILDHIKKEMDEVINSRGLIEEWTDIIILAFDGAIRCGYTPEEIIAELQRKQTVNENRKLSDWHTAAPGKAIEHIRENVR